MIKPQDLFSSRKDFSPRVTFGTISGFLAAPPGQLQEVPQFGLRCQRPKGRPQGIRIDLLQRNPSPRIDGDVSAYSESPESMANHCFTWPLFENHGLRVWFLYERRAFFVIIFRLSFHIRCLVNNFNTAKKLAACMHEKKVLATFSAAGTLVLLRFSTVPRAESHSWLFCSIFGPKTSLWRWRWASS